MSCPDCEKWKHSALLAGMAADKAGAALAAAAEVITQRTDALNHLWWAARDALDVIQCLQTAFPDTVGKLALRETTERLRKLLGNQQNPIVHILYHGRTLCELSAEPKLWPKGELWFSIEEAHKATCERCKANHEILRHSP